MYDIITQTMIRTAGLLLNRKRSAIRHLSATLLLLCLGTLVVISQPLQRFQKVLVETDNAERLLHLPSFDAHTLHPILGKGLELILAEADVQTLRAEGYRVTCTVEDLQKFYAARSAAGMHNINAGFGKAIDENTPANFNTGSHYGFYTVQELEQELEKMHTLYPELASEPISIGKSVEGRDIWAVRISAQSESESVPEAFFNGMHHAREPMSMMSLVYSMWHVLEEYQNNPDINSLLKSRALWFVPLVNPDGYQYNLTYFPEGGGLWRKNVGGANKQGVDLNRNYSVAETWGPPENPALVDPASGNYRGGVPFSEPETRAIRDFVFSRNFRLVLNYHSISNVLIYMHEGTLPELADTAWYFLSARELTLDNGFGHGRGEEAIGYEAPGAAEDWLFRQNVSSERIFAWTPEIGSVEDGFWPSPERIIPLCKRSLNMALRTAWMAGPYPQVTAWRSEDRGSPNAPTIIARITNVGVQPMVETGSITIAGNEATTERFSLLRPGESTEVQLSVPSEFIASTLPRTETQLEIAYKEWKWNRTVNVMNHPHVTFFTENFEQTLSRWKNDLWGLETVADHGRVLSDSPYENYFESDLPNRIELAEPIPLDLFDAAELRFEAKALTRGVQVRLLVEARRSSERTWHKLDGEYLQSSHTTTETTRNELRGANRMWETLILPLDEFVGDDVLLRFTMEAPITGSSGRLFDGIFIDNLRVVGGFKPPSSAPNESDTKVTQLAWPNPASNRIYVQSPKSSDSITVRIVDMLGREVLMETGVNGLWMNIEELPSGPYLLSITGREFVALEKIICR